MRLYTWQPGAITFGVNQREEKAFDHSRVGDTPVIRRVTGGRAIYHDPSELTYAVAVHSDASPVPAWQGSRSETAASIAHMLQSFLQAVGIATDYARQSSAENARPDFFHSAPCFASHARYELLGATGKVVASAQRRLEHSFLQHGAIKFDGVAPHPALGTDWSGKELAPLDRTRFAFLANRFEHTFARLYGRSPDTGVIDGIAVERLSRYTEFVRKNSRLRRDVIKQISAGVSL